uniref:Uncharacterized protein n=1 Tax=Candidatus Kentrum sp. LPFa TaxID=2126335 RepID=A0A450XAI0_9GAMM|nr:MAG: hypothetical protein BECKLPF1236B_GA0070989_15791 [Candidatus Kentron sp. LPFa]
MRNIVEEALHIGIQDNLVPLLPKVQYPLEGQMTISPREISPVCRNPNESSWNSGSSIRDKRYLKHFLCNPVAYHRDARGRIIRYRKKS